MKTIIKTKTIVSFLIAFFVLVGIQQQAKGMKVVQPQRAIKHKGLRELFADIANAKSKKKIDHWVKNMDPAHFFSEVAFKEDFSKKYQVLERIDIVSGQNEPLQWFTKKGYEAFEKAFKIAHDLTVEEYEDKWEDERNRLSEKFEG